MVTKFDLERLKNGEMPVTRDGRKIVEAYICSQPVEYPIVAGGADVYSFTKEGVHVDGSISGAALVASDCAVPRR